MRKIFSREEVINKILDAISKQAFAEWYQPEGDFDAYISGDEPRPTEEKIKKDIANLFGLS